MLQKSITSIIDLLCSAVKDGWGVCADAEYFTEFSFGTTHASTHACTHVHMHRHKVM